MMRGLTMINKINLAGMAFVILAGSVGAQDSNPNSPAYHALHNPQSPNYVGPRSTVQPASQPTGYWQKTWGAIATSETGGALGTAVGLPDRSQAELVAMQDCKAKGGGGCRVDLAYHNQCAVMMLGGRGISMSRAASIDEATANGHASCQKKGDSCRVYYSACSEPKFHNY